MKQLVMVIFMIAMGSFVFAKQTGKHDVIISCKVIHVTDSTPKVFKVNFLNPFANRAQSAKLNERNEFSVRQEMLFTQNMTIQYNGTFINLYVSPGDSVDLIIDASLLRQPNFGWLTIGGDHALLSTQVNNCHSYLSRIKTLDYDYTMSPEGILAAVKTDYERQIKVLDTYATKNSLDRTVIEWAKRDIKYAIGNWVSDYLYVDTIPAEQKLARVRLFADPFFDMYDPANFQTMMFPYHLGAYASRITRSDPVVSKLIKEGMVQQAVKKGIDVLMLEPAGVCRDYMLYNFISSFTNKTPGLLDSLADASRYFTNALYYGELTKSTALGKSNEFPRTEIAGMEYLKATGSIHPVPVTDIFDFLVKKHAGKILYIDVYATWCSPCLAEMKYVPRLHKTLKKEVVFINLCLQSSKSNWQKLVKEKNITGENYFFGEDATKLLMGNYRLAGFPSYILVNKKGKIVTTSAPRPSEGKDLQKIIANLAR
jgi:thiol-disulfide isomerase/thioredoxin